jgi:hypothetical protein
MSLPSLGEPAVHELLGNPDMHLKNNGLRYEKPASGMLRGEPRRFFWGTIAVFYAPFRFQKN